MKLRNLRRRIAIALAACGIAVPSSALAADLQVNLVANPGFENVNTMDPGPFTSVRILDWSDADADADDTFAYPYSSDYSGVPAPPGAGDYHFTGGFGTTAGTATITQSIDVSTGDTGTLIATGTARYDMRGFFSTFFAQGEASRIRVRFLNTGMTELGSVDIGGVDFLDGLPIVADRTYWGQDAATGTLPVGTATVAVDVIPDGSATNFDAYVDNLDFRVGGLPDDVALKLEVNQDTGQARLRNLTGGALESPIDIKYYEITSASGALDPVGWMSLQDQDFEGSGGTSGNGDGWEESGGVSANILSESFLLGSSVLADLQSVSLGTPFTTGSAEDLVFRYGLANGLLLYGIVDFDADFGVTGDFNGDGLWDCVDINALTTAVADDSTDLSFDMNGDGEITLADITDEGVGWLAVGGANNSDDTGGNAFLVGDANLDGSVDVSDFNSWNGNKFTSLAEWCAGDFNADGSVDVSDFNSWNGNKFNSSAGNIAGVPEPQTILLFGLGIAGCAALLRRQKEQHNDAEKQLNDQEEISR